MFFDRYQIGTIKLFLSDYLLPLRDYNVVCPKFIVMGQKRSIPVEGMPLAQLQGGVPELLAEGL